MLADTDDSAVSESPSCKFQNKWVGCVWIQQSQITCQRNKCSHLKPSFHVHPRKCYQMLLLSSGRALPQEGNRLAGQTVRPEKPRS